MDSSFNPNLCAAANGNFIGLPVTFPDANVVFFPVPWEVTVSYRPGTAYAHENILNASLQLDLSDGDVKDAWKVGHFYLPADEVKQMQCNSLRPKAEKYISFLEQGGNPEEAPEYNAILQEINTACEDMTLWVKTETLELLRQKKLVGLVGGDHSTPLGFLQALAEHYPLFGVLHIDAHFDLRDAYEGFTYSHASIFHNALEIHAVNKVVSVGIRDFCEEETDKVLKERGRVEVHYDSAIRRAIMDGTPFRKIAKRIIKNLPQYVYISFDIDGLNPTLCPNTGTPVPGGLEYNEVVYLLKLLVESGRTIIGFDLVEVGSASEWDGNVGARLLYKLSNLMAASNGLTELTR